MMNLKTYALPAALLMAATASAADFNTNFADSTLRIDYIMAGNATTSHVFLDRQTKSPQWAGRRHHLSELPYAGNGCITVVDSVSGDTIYRTSFSTLFNEWQSTPEAQETSRSFQNTFLVPLPRKTAKITIDMYNQRHDLVATNTHYYRPGDILVGRRAVKPNPYKVIHQGGPSDKAIDVAILAEGYTEEEMPIFFEKAQAVVDAMFTHEPYKSRQADFNFIAVASPSESSGVSVPLKDDWKSTPFNSHFSTFYSDRYLTTNSVSLIHDALQGIPYEHIIVLANSPVYGGGGIYNSYTLTTANHDNFAPVVVHEFGHSFGGLADEYFYENEVMKDSYPTDVEPWEPNITTLTNFDDKKWGSLLAKDTPVPTPVELKEKYPAGVYEGAAYSFKGIYRPADECRMRNNTWPAFCPGCQLALTRLIDFYTKE